MKIIYGGLVLLLLVLHSCYEDKGNYDYTELNRVTIERFEYDKGSYTMGDTMTVRPVLKFSQDSSVSDFTYEWQLAGGRVIGRERVLTYIADTSASRAIPFLLKIKSKDGVEFSKMQSISIYACYSKGWVVLAEKDGQSYLSFLEDQTREEDGEEIDYFKEVPDIYLKENKQGLGGHPIKVHEFFAGFDVTSHLAIFQEGGLGTVCVDGGTFKKTIDLNEMFIQGKYPPGFVPCDGIFADYGDIVLGTNHELYYKKNENTSAYYTGKYPDFPMYFRDGLEVTHLIRTKYYDHYFNVFFDGKNKRFMGVVDFAYASNKGAVIEITHADVPGFNNLNHMGEETEYMFCDCANVSRSANFFNLFRNKTENKYYMQKFTISYNFINGGLLATPLWQKEFPGASLMNGKNVFAITRDAKQYLFFSAGEKQDKLYGYMFSAGGGEAVPLYDFEGQEITALYVAYEKIGVGLANGKFCLMDISLDAFKNGSKILLESKVDLGKIKSIHYKVDNRMSSY